MMEFRYKERHEPAGLMYGQRAMDTWLYGGDPAMNLTIGGIFEELRGKTEEGFFEELLKEFILDEEHLARIIAVPSETLLAEKAEKEKARLHAAKESWGDSLKDYIALNAKLDEWQQTPDTPEAIASLPRLFLSDLSELSAAGPEAQEISAASRKNICRPWGSMAACLARCPQRTKQWMTCRKRCAVILAP